jgi:hypothetical protein
MAFKTSCTRFIWRNNPHNSVLKNGVNGIPNGDPGIGNWLAKQFLTVYVGNGGTAGA